MRAIAPGRHRGNRNRLPHRGEGSVTPGSLSPQPRTCPDFHDRAVVGQTAEAVEPPRTIDAVARRYGSDDCSDATSAQVGAVAAGRVRLMGRKGCVAAGPGVGGTTDQAGSDVAVPSEDGG